jgi:UDP-glucose 4-epimerase
MKAIVTGGAGFIGSHLTRRLLKEGWDVLVLDNLCSGYRTNIPAGARFQWIDLAQENVSTQLPKEHFDVIFHLASHVGQETSFEQPLHDLKSNIFPTMSLLSWAIERGVRQIVFASSVNLYGNPVQVPVDESAVISLPSPYAVGKFASEALCQIYANFGISYTCLRLFNIYGPGQDIQNLMQGMASIYMAYVAKNQPILVRGSLERFRDFVFVTDAADAFYRCVNKKAYGKTYNLCTGKKTYVRDLLNMIILAFGHDPESYPIVTGDPTRQDQFGFYGDPSLIGTELGWTPKVAVEDGIKEMAQDFRIRTQ